MGYSARRQLAIGLKRGEKGGARKGRGYRLGFLWGEKGRRK